MIGDDRVRQRGAGARRVPTTAGFAAELVSDAIVEYLRKTAATLRNATFPPLIGPVQAALQAYGTEVASVRSEGLTRGLPGDVAERFFALGFSLEQMRQNLKDLERCVADWAEAPAGSRSKTAYGAE